MASRGRKDDVTLVEVSSPDQRRMKEGLRLLARMIARAYVKDKGPADTNGHQDPALIPSEEEQ